MIPLAHAKAFLILLSLCCSLPTLAVAQSKASSEPLIVGRNIGIDATSCETTKADFDLIAQTANGKESNVIVIARLGKGERSRSISRLRLRQVREWLLMVRGYSPGRIITAEGERSRGLGRVEVYISGKPFIIYHMKRNKDFFRGYDGC
jgi:hypothetical protein